MAGRGLLCVVVSDNRVRICVHEAPREAMAFVEAYLPFR